MPHGSEKRPPKDDGRAVGAHFVTNSVRDVAISSNRPDSPREAGRLPVVTAFPLASTALQTSGKAELASMLPGFRFLFAAIVLSMSVLVFGLGAAALLRAAHEEFASIPSRRAPPEPVFAQQNEPPMPTLALLRFEPRRPRRCRTMSRRTAIGETVTRPAQAPGAGVEKNQPPRSRKNSPR